VEADFGAVATPGADAPTEAFVLAVDARAAHDADAQGQEPDDQVPLHVTSLARMPARCNSTCAGRCSE
jgi:hypothetical protein